MIFNNRSFFADNGGRRSGSERRFFTYSFHIPERRSGDERRTLEERRGKKRAIDFCKDYKN